MGSRMMPLQKDLNHFCYNSFGEGNNQEIMGVYLSSCGKGEWIRAEHSSHDIHLTDPELICRLV